jgi:glycosyltransferase involved in cell wall biosynthesis
MKISVIIPCYNEIKTIALILTKIREQNFENIEIILVDDCSNDGTRELIKGSLFHLCNEVIFHEK